MLGIPDRTRYDLQFRLFGIPVRIHPLFWLVAALLHGMGPETHADDVVIWVVCVLVSILAHEFGHALTGRLFGCRSSIVLHGFLGTTTPDYGRTMSPGERFLMVLMGPGAGFLLLGAVLAVLFALYRITPSEALALLGLGSRDKVMPFILKLGPMGRGAKLLIYYLLQINFFWSVFNLMPTLPLDGGKLTGIGIGLVNPRASKQWVYIISLVTSGILAIACFKLLGSLFMAMLFGYFAVMNYQYLQTVQSMERYGIDQGEEW